MDCSPADGYLPLRRPTAALLRNALNSKPLPFDHLHGGGKPATLRLASLAGIGPGSRVADLGGGIGGPARTLAAELGCTVDVVDLTEEFCKVGAWLTSLTKLEDKIRFYHASALQTTLPSGAYNIVWMENSGMNIEDRQTLYNEVHRLLRPAGRYALAEVMAGPVTPMHYPMNWASASEMVLPLSTRRSVQLHRSCGVP